MSVYSNQVNGVMAFTRQWEWLLEDDDLVLPMAVRSWRIEQKYLQGVNLARGKRGLAISWRMRHGFPLIQLVLAPNDMDQDITRAMFVDAVQEALNALPMHSETRRNAVTWPGNREYRVYARDLIAFGNAFQQAFDLRLRQHRLGAESYLSSMELNTVFPRSMLNALPLNFLEELVVHVRLSIKQPGVAGFWDWIKTSNKLAPFESVEKTFLGLIGRKGGFKFTFDRQVEPAFATTKTITVQNTLYQEFSQSRIVPFARPSALHLLTEDPQPDCDMRKYLDYIQVVFDDHRNFIRRREDVAIWQAVVGIVNPNANDALGKVFEEVDRLGGLDIRTVVEAIPLRRLTTLIQQNVEPLLRTVERLANVHQFSRQGNPLYVPSYGMYTTLCLNSYTFVNYD